MAKLHVSTTINGEPMEFLCEPSDTMLDALRGPLGLTGSKEGCASGDCGACSITVDDRLICSCLMLAVEAQGQRRQRTMRQPYFHRSRDRPELCAPRVETLGPRRLPGCDMAENEIRVPGECFGI